MRELCALFAAALVLVVACGPVTSRDRAIAEGKAEVGAIQVTRADAKELTWSQWQRGSGNIGGPDPAPPPTTKVWVIALKGSFTKLGPGSARSVVVVLDAKGAKTIVVVGDGDWPAYWDAL